MLGDFSLRQGKPGIEVPVERRAAEAAPTPNRPLRTRRKKTSVNAKQARQRGWKKLVTLKTRRKKLKATRSRDDASNRCGGMNPVPVTKYRSP
jgi:hypothetical protein